MYENRTLVRGDNLEEMWKFPDDCIDLIATDPPFNSKRNYFVPYRDAHGQEPDTLIRAFTDTWTWGEAAEDAYQHLLVEEGGQIGNTIQGLRQFLNETPMMAYLVMMAIRIVEMHRILKTTGSLYLHCDPSASHYLKIILDAILGASNFRTFRAGDPPEPVLTFSIPPQAPAGILPQIAMLSATTNTADTQHAFDGQPVTFSVHTGGNLQWADGAQVYQFQDARLTAASVFEYPTDADGKRKLQETPIGLTPTAEKRLAKLNNWAKATDGLTAFISYKEFTEEPFGEAVNGFDDVKHFDDVAGLNFDDLKFLVVFGYPKVKHEIVVEHARKQYASDSDPLPEAAPTLTDDNGKNITEYMQLTEDITVTENGITITERRYKDPRLEKIRRQLATEKVEQAVGRARLPVWTDTTTLIFTDTPIGNITDRATLFSTAAFNLAETHSGLSEAMDRIQDAEATGDVKAVMETHDVGKSQAYDLTKETRAQQNAEKNAELLSKAEELLHKGMSQRGAAKALNITLGKLQSLLKRK